MTTRTLIAAFALMGASAAAPPPESLPGWMAGCWIEEAGNRWTEECWTAPRAGLMIGSGRSGRGDTLYSWEVMQVTAAAGGEGAAFYAAPGGAGRTRFTAERLTDREAVFVNGANDYPQRVRYWREGDALLAEIAMADGSRAMRWRFRRQG